MKRQQQPQKSTQQQQSLQQQVAKLRKTVAASTNLPSSVRAQARRNLLSLGQMFRHQALPASAQEREDRRQLRRNLRSYSIPTVHPAPLPVINAAQEAHAFGAGNASLDQLDLHTVHEESQNGQTFYRVGNVRFTIKRIGFVNAKNMRLHDLHYKVDTHIEGGGEPPLLAHVVYTVVRTAVMHVLQALRELFKDPAIHNEVFFTFFSDKLTVNTGSKPLWRDFQGNKEYTLEDLSEYFIMNLANLLRSKDNLPLDESFHFKVNPKLLKSLLLKCKYIHKITGASVGSFTQPKYRKYAKTNTSGQSEALVIWQE